jgi:hypothetical protein
MISSRTQSVLPDYSTSINTGNSEEDWFLDAVPYSLVKLTDVSEVLTSHIIRAIIALMV